ncbi:MAG: uroporphyrinogen decarboxylase [Bacilli bacterium]
MKHFNDTMLRTARGEQTTYTPVWFMRQAGRSQPEYRAIKEKYSLFEITHNPELCAYVTHLPVQNYDVDAAILYKDIMTPLPGMGVDVEIKNGIGPVIANPITSLSDVERLGTLDPISHIPYVLDTISILTKEQLSVPLIGFSGAPFTLASYMVEGGPSRNFHRTKALMVEQPLTWALLMEKLANMVITYVTAQVQAGATLIQLFDSWVGTLSVEQYRMYIKPWMDKIFKALSPLNVPLIMFGVGAGHLVEEWNDFDIDVIGLDWRTPISSAKKKGITKTVQGNLEPSLLLTDWQHIERHAKKIVQEGLQHGSHIFNLGHGVFPEVQPETLRQLSHFVKSYSAALRNGEKIE